MWLWYIGGKRRKKERDVPSSASWTGSPIEERADIMPVIVGIVDRDADRDWLGSSW